jgi:hypothetical protein
MVCFAKHTLNKHNLGRLGLKPKSDPLSFFFSFLFFFFWAEFALFSCNNYTETERRRRLYLVKPKAKVTVQHRLENALLFLLFLVSPPFVLGFLFLGYLLCFLTSVVSPVFLLCFFLCFSPSFFFFVFFSISSTPSMCIH